MRRFFYWFSRLFLALILILFIYHPYISVDINGAHPIYPSIFTALLGVMYPYGLILVVVLLLITSSSNTRGLKIIRWILGITSVLVSLGYAMFWMQIAASTDKAEAAFGFAAILILSAYLLWVEIAALLVAEFSTLHPDQISNIEIEEAGWGPIRNVISGVLVLGIFGLFGYSIFIYTPLPSQGSCSPAWQIQAANLVAYHAYGSIESISTNPQTISVSANGGYGTYIFPIDSSTMIVSGSGDPLIFADLGRRDGVEVDGKGGENCAFVAQKVIMRASGLHEQTVLGKITDIFDYSSTITSIPQTITIIGADGHLLTFPLASSTIFKTEAGATTTLNNFHVTDSVSIKAETRSDDKTFTPDEIDKVSELTQIQLPSAPEGTQKISLSGKITNINGSNIVLSANDGKTYTIQTTSSQHLYATTFIFSTGASTNFASFHNGDFIAVTGHGSASYLAGNMLIADTVQKTSK